MNASTLRVPGTEEERRHLAWETTLDRLELDVLVGTRLLAATGGPGASAGEGPELPRLHDWEQPDGLGPIPADLVDRARDLRSRQHEVQQQLATAMADTRRRHAATERTPSGTYGAASSPAAYLDLRA